MKIYKWEIAAIIVGLAMIALGKTANAGETKIYTNADGRNWTINIPPRTEHDYQIPYCAALDGAWEVKIPQESGIGFPRRADCVFEFKGVRFAVEHDFSPHQWESGSQAIWYSNRMREITGISHKPAVVLIKRPKEPDVTFANAVATWRKNSRTRLKQFIPQLACLTWDGKAVVVFDCPGGDE